MDYIKKETFISIIGFLVKKTNFPYQLNEFQQTRKRFQIAGVQDQRRGGLTCGDSSGYPDGVRHLDGLEVSNAPEIGIYIGTTTALYIHTKSINIIYLDRF